MIKSPLGFADERQAAEFFGLPVVEVRKKAASGEWPSWVIAGRRVFDLDQLVSTLARK